MVTRLNIAARPLWMTLGLVLLLTACGDPDDVADSSNPNPPAYIVGGTVAGIDTGAPVALSINGNAPVPLNADGTFAFDDTPLTSAAAYTVTAATAAGQDCTVVNGTGVVAAESVDNVEVLCHPVTASSALSALMTRIAAMQLETDDLELLDANYLDGGYTAATLHVPASFSTTSAMALTMDTPQTAPLPAQWTQVYTFTLNSAQRVRFDISLPFHTTWRLYNGNKVQLRNLTDCFYASYCTDAPDDEFPPYLHAMNLSLPAGTYYIVADNSFGGTTGGATYTVKISDGTGQPVSPLYPNIGSPAMAASPGTGRFDVAFDTGTNAYNRTRAIIRTWRLTNGELTLMGNQKPFAVLGFGTSLELGVSSRAGVVTNHVNYEARLHAVRGLDLAAAQASVPENSDLEFRRFNSDTKTEEKLSTLSLTCAGTPVTGTTCYTGPYYLAVKRSVDIPRPTTVRISTRTSGDVETHQDLLASWHWPRSGTLKHALTATAATQSWSGWRSGPMVFGLAEVYGFPKNSGGDEVFDFLPGAAGSLSLALPEIEIYGGIMQTSEFVRPDTYWHFLRHFYVDPNPLIGLASSAAPMETAAPGSPLSQLAQRLPGGAFRMATVEMTPQSARP